MDVNLPIGDFLAIPIVGIALSLLVQWIKAEFPMSKISAKLTVLVLSLLVGTFYYFIRQTPYWLPILGILGVSTTVWAFFLNNEEPVV